jgi:hypothetical protein
MAKMLEYMVRSQLPMLAKAINLRVDHVKGETYQQREIQQPGKRLQGLLTSFLRLG